MKKVKNEYSKILIKMSLPILMNYLIMTLFEVIDKAIVGNYSTEGFAAIGVAANFIYLVTGALGVLSAAYNIIAAQFWGKNDKKQFNATFKTVMVITIVIGTLIIALSFVGGRLLFEKVYGLKNGILLLALDYFYIASVTVMMNMIIFNFSVYFRNMKNTKISFYSTIVSTVINIAFDYALVYGRFGLPELGVKGAAIGSVIGLSGGILVYLIKFKADKEKMIKIKADKEVAKRIIKLYIPLLAQDIVEGTIFTMILTSFISRMSVINIATYNLLETIIGAVALPMFALSSSAITLALQKSFSKDRKDTLRIINTAISISILMIVSLGNIILLFPRVTMAIISKDNLVIDKAERVLLFAIIAVILKTFTVVYKSFLQGINNESFVFKSTVIISFLSLFWIYALVRIYGLRGIYIGIAINNMIFSIIYFKRIRNNMKLKN
ncbi:MATE family efflux transporter [uncultured Clostridium sp.]|uniref:MATE family efflux transporter n=1 Tax=uncultured Clostridium sp. TaxID=59620 RepID=UPI002671EEA0|nr:MATE family efflux transporter [uncultured Clostridium sp.]